MRLKITGLLMVAMCMIGLNACGNDDSVSFDASSVSCDNVASELNNAATVKDTANAKLADVNGTPDEKTFKQEIEEASAKIDALQDRQQECQDEAPATPSPSADPTESADFPTAAEISEQVTKDLLKHYKGFGGKNGTLQVGDDQPIPDKTREAATLAFTGRTLKTQRMLGTFLGSDDKLAVQARGRIRTALLENGYDKAEVKRALSSGDHWVWVAPTVASQISGTTYPVKGDIVKEKGFRSVAANDAIWWYVTSDGHVLADATVRADCGNPEVTTITPIPPGKNPPPISQPPGHPCVKPPVPGPGTYVYNPTTCTWHKPPQSFDDQQNNSPADQPVQQNPGQPTGNTPGAPSSPSQPPQGPTPHDGSSAPPAQQGGHDSGSGSGSGTPGGSTCSGGSCQGGGSTPGTGDGGAGQGGTSDDDSDGTVPTPPAAP